MANFLDKWIAKKADRPKVGTKNAVDTFQSRVAEQKAYLEEYERDAAGFKKWRSTWFQKVVGGFGVSVGRDSIDAGEGLSYVVVSSTKEVSEFLDDLAYHAEKDVGFQQALEENRLRRVARLSGAKSGARATSKSAATTVAPKAAAKAAGLKNTRASGPRAPKATASIPDADKPKPGRRAKKTAA